MRLYPVAASGTARQTEEDMTLHGYAIPAGTVLVVPLYPLLNSPHVWDKPAEFRPVRAVCVFLSRWHACVPD